jgi:hypothetical protein
MILVRVEAARNSSNATVKRKHKEQETLANSNPVSPLVKRDFFVLERWPLRTNAKRHLERSRKI